MTATQPHRRIVIHNAGFIATILTVVGLSLAQWAYSSCDAPDWRGYEDLYEGSADWLTPNGLAPLFMYIVVGARSIFGPDGYGLFRLVVFALFAGFAGWLAYIMPVQRRLGGATILVTCGVVSTALLLKSVVQIREGLAFVVALAGILAVLRHNNTPLAKSGASVAIAPFVHAGIASLSGVWLLAVALTCVPRRLLESRWLHMTMGMIALTMGLGLALTLIANDDSVAAYVTNLGIETSATAQGGLFKIAYWSVLGLVVYVLGRQCFGPGDKLSIALSLALGMGLLPLSYGFCMTLVVTNFNVPAVTSMGIRILFTGLDLALIIICVAGRANALTAGIVTLMLADELRLLAAA